MVILLAWGCVGTWLYGWRILIAICTAPLLLFLCSSFWMPESILYLVKKGKQEQAEAEKPKDEEFCNCVCSNHRCF